MTEPQNGVFMALDPVLHQPVRTRIVAFLSARGEATFSEFKQALQLTDGNLEAHMKKLTQVNYVSVRKEAAGKRPLTFYTLSEQGEKAFATYVQALNNLLKMEM